jgi:uncharacterized protein YceK
MKKKLIFLIALIMTVVLSGCGTASSTSVTSQVAAAVTSQTLTITTTMAESTTTTKKPKTTIVTPASISTTISATTFSATDPAQTVGLFLNDPRAYTGYTLLAPKQYTSTYLIDNNGKIVHQWTASKYPPGQSAYLLANGDLIRACSVRNPDLSTGGGEGGRIEEFNWDGTMVWSLDYTTPLYMQHHDFVVLPNGNILMLVVEKKTYDEAIAAGFDPGKLNGEIKTNGYMVPDSIVEIKPTLPSGGTVVWSWHVWDHLVQSYSSSKSNYGVIAAHPELIDPNGGGQIPAFWNHMNSITYNPALDQVMVSVRGNSEIWIIDHSTTTAQAAGHTGGVHGKGGDLLYRWGNPAQYGAGTRNDDALFQQHCAVWIDSKLPGAGDILIFNNGLGRGYTTIDQITPPVDAGGNYNLAAGKPYGPTSLTWTYKANPPTSFFASEISGAQRLPNGNTLICDGIHGTIFEVTAAGETVWKYVDPVGKTGPLGRDDAIPPDPAKQGSFMNEVFRVVKYGPDYPGLAGRTLTPGATIEK